MKTIFASCLLVVCLAGCTRSNALAIPEDLAGDGGNSDGGLSDGAADGGNLGRDMSGVKDQGLGGDMSEKRVCGSSGMCIGGPACAGGQNGCCGGGEWCDSTGKCRCGNGAGCPANNPVCATGGPIGGNTCGTICCGGLGNPCPL